MVKPSIYINKSFSVAGYRINNCVAGSDPTHRPRYLIPIPPRPSPRLHSPVWLGSSSRPHPHAALAPGSASADCARARMLAQIAHEQKTLPTTCFLLGQAHRRRIGDDLGLAARSATTQDSYPSQLICDHGIPRAAAASVGGRGGGPATALRRPLPSPPPQHPPTATFSSRLASCRWHQIPAAIHGETLGLRTGWGLTSLPRQSDLLLAGVTPERVTAYELPCR